MFPAPVGMNRTPAFSHAATVHVPRACGDEPAHFVTLPCLTRCSPRLWG